MSAPGLPDLNGWREALAPAADMAREAATALAALAERPEIALAFLAGALALAAGARLCLIAAALAAGLWALEHWSLVAFGPETGPLIAVAAGVLFLLGIAQGLVTLIAGEEAAGAALAALIFGALAFALWRGPGRLLALLLGRR